MANLKDVTIMKKKKNKKDKKDKKRKKTKKKIKKASERGITVNINLARAIGEAKAKAPKTTRGFAPKVASIRGQRSRGGGEVNTRQAEINTNLLNNVYSIRAQATKQQEAFEQLAKEQGATIKELSSNIGVLQNQLTQLGTQAMNPPQQPININIPPAQVPAIEDAPQVPAIEDAPIEDAPEEEQQFRKDMKKALLRIGQQQQGLYQGVQLLVDSQHGIHNRLAGIEEAGRQMAGNQGTLLALESIYDEGDDEAMVQPQQPASAPPSPPTPPPPPMETITEEDPLHYPARMSSSVDPQQKEKPSLLIDVAQPTLNQRKPRATITAENLTTIGRIYDKVKDMNRSQKSTEYATNIDYQNLLKDGMLQNTLDKAINDYPEREERILKKLMGQMVEKVEKVETKRLKKEKKAREKMATTIKKTRAKRKKSKREKEEKKET